MNSTFSPPRLATAAMTIERVIGIPTLLCKTQKRLLFMGS